VKLASLKSLFVVQTPDDTPAPKKPVVVAAPVVLGGPAQVDANAQEIILAAIEKANKPGYDYFEFAQALQQQEKIIAAEDLRFQSTFAVASSMGVTVRGLLETGRGYLDVVTDERKKFEQVLLQQTDATVTAKEKEMVAIDSEIKDSATKIQTLTESINAAQQKKMQLNTDLINNRGKIEQVRANFDMTAGVIETKIKKDLDCIARYIPDLKGVK
jgi:hypothetical protein